MAAYCTRYVIFLSFGMVLNAECLCGEFYPSVQTYSLTSLATKPQKYIYV